MTHLPRRQRWPFIVVVAAAAASAAAPAPPTAAPPEIHPLLPYRSPHLTPSSARCRQTVLIARKVVCLLVVVVALLFSVYLYYESKAKRVRQGLAGGVGRREGSRGVVVVVGAVSEQPQFSQ